MSYPLIFNKEIPQILGSDELPSFEDPYKILQKPETKLRELIQVELGKVSEIGGNKEYQTMSERKRN